MRPVNEKDRDRERRSERNLSEKRLQVLRVLGRYQGAEAFPLVREVATELGLATEGSLRSLLRPLVRDSYLVKHGGGKERRQCVYTLTPKAEQVVPEVRGDLMQSDSVPSISLQRMLLPRLGRVTAGLLREAVQECGEWVDVSDVLKAQPGDFLLEADGDSMIGDGILDGDWVQIRPGVQIHHNEIAVVQVNHDNGVYESTLKHIRFQPGKKTVTLRASNPVYEDIMLPAKKVEVVGAYRGLIRPAPMTGNTRQRGRR